MATGFISYISRLSALLLFGVCNHCGLACFLLSTNFDRLSNHDLCCFHSFWLRLFLAEYVYSMYCFSQAIFLSLLSSKFYLTSTSISFLRMNISISYFCASRLLTDSLFLTFSTTRYFNGITISSRERTVIKYTWMPSPVYQDVINMNFSLPIRRGPGVSVSISILCS